MSAGLRSFARRLSPSFHVLLLTLSVTSALPSIRSSTCCFMTRIPRQENPVPCFASEACQELRMPLGINIPILYESDRVLAVNKPHGIPHHDDVVSGTAGILTLIRMLQKRDDETGISYKGRVFGVHRLDRATSGILLFAKDAKTAGMLCKSFREKDVVKYYVAVSSKKPKKSKQGWIRGDMAKGRRGGWILKKTTINPAVTRFFTAGLGGLSDNAIGNLSIAGGSEVVAQEGKTPLPRTVILFRPHTGRTHQLRVAAKSVGLPILFDPYYGDGSSFICDPDQNQHNMVHRTYLHSLALHLDLDGKEAITIWCPPPFGDLLWESNGSSGFDKIVGRLLEKHCESEEILGELQKQNKSGK